MLKVNFNFLPDSTNGWPQTIIDSVTDFAGKSFQWIQDTHRNEFVGYGMFAAVTTVSFLAADKLATTLSTRIDAKFTNNDGDMTADRKQMKGVLLNVVITGGLTYAGNLLYSTLSGHTLPRTILLATAVAACAVRYLVEARREANPTLRPTTPPGTNSTSSGNRDIIGDGSAEKKTSLVI